MPYDNLLFGKIVHFELRKQALRKTMTGKMSLCYHVVKIYLPFCCSLHFIAVVCGCIIYLNRS